MDASEPLRLRDIFSTYLRVDPALDENSRDEAFRVRHEVYCDEFKFLPRRPDQREIDADDAHSVQSLLRTAHGPHATVGCVRVVRTNPANRQAPLPFERPCAQTLDIDTAELPRDRIGEISRLTLRQQYRGASIRGALTRQAEGLSGADQARMRFVFTVSLTLAAFALAKECKIDTVFSLSEPSMPKSLEHIGVSNRQIGGPVWHHGTRIPLMMQVVETIDELGYLIRPMWDIVDQQISQGFSR